MRDYSVTESTLCEREEVGNITIKIDIQETFNVLVEMNKLLSEFAQIINGQSHDETVRKDVCCMREEARMMTSLAHENLKRLIDIKDSII